MVQNLSRFKTKDGYKLTIWYNLPYLVISLVPLPQHNSSTILDATGFLIAVESIDIQANVINHSYSSVAIMDFLALAP